MYTIDNVAIAFDIRIFEALCAEEKITWFLSSLNDLRKLLAKKVQPSAEQVLVEIRKIPIDKRLKYKSALKYLIFSWPGMAKGLGINEVADGRLFDRMKFLEYYATMDTSTDYVDLQYGIAAARTFAPYQLDQGRVRFADDFNNSSKLGKGEAFNRTWQGYGTLNATPQTVRSDFRQGGTLLRGIQADTRQIYANSMLNSRYSPERSLRDDKKKLRNDTQKSYAQMEKIHGKSEAEAHFWRHAAFVKSVRRACKGGIAMVASHPSYCNVEAKVHFVLDGLGDLGKMARKDKLAADKGGYLAITSSELAFCCRYWNDEKYPLSQVVKFYVNGDRVMPPWEANYRQQGADGTEVYSNQEAWLRYQLTRDLLFQKKPFPVMSGSADPDEFSDD